MKGSLGRRQECNPFLDPLLDRYRNAPDSFYGAFRRDGAWHDVLDPFEWAAYPALLFEAIERYQATHDWLPNFAFMHLVRTAGAADRRDLSSLVALISCSEPCKPAAFDAFAERFGGWGFRAEALQTCYAI